MLAAPRRPAAWRPRGPGVRRPEAGAGAAPPVLARRPGCVLPPRGPCPSIASLPQQRSRPGAPVTSPATERAQRRRAWRAKLSRSPRRGRVAPEPRGLRAPRGGAQEAEAPLLLRLGRRLSPACRDEAAPARWQPRGAGRAVPRRQPYISSPRTRKAGEARRCRTRLPPRPRGLLSPPPVTICRLLGRPPAALRCGGRQTGDARARGSRGLSVGRRPREASPARRSCPGAPRPPGPGARANSGRAGAATRGRAEAAALGLGFGSYRRGAPAAYPGRPALGRRVEGRGAAASSASLRSGRAQRWGRGGAACPFASQTTPPWSPRPSWGRARSRREGFLFLAPHAPPALTAHARTQGVSPRDSVCLGRVGPPGIRGS